MNTNTLIRSNLRRLLWLVLVLFSWALLLVACKSEPAPLPGDTNPERPWSASSAPPAQAPPVVGLVDEKLFSIDSIMRHQSALGIRPEQKDALLVEWDASQKELNRLEWDLSGEKERLAAALSGTSVDETAAMQAGSSVTDLEGKLKLSHLRLLVRVKNLLTPEQQAKLRALREKGE